MTDLGYAFWCSRCRFEHPGECETIVTAASGKSAAVDVTGTLGAGAKALLSFAGLSAQVFGIPAVGSRWQVQDKDHNTGTWGWTHGLVYEVVKVIGSRVWIRDATTGTGSGEYEYGLQPWQDVLSWRFVSSPAP